MFKLLQSFTFCANLKNPINRFAYQKRIYAAVCKRLCVQNKIRSTTHWTDLGYKLVLVYLVVFRQWIIALSSSDRIMGIALCHLVNSYCFKVLELYASPIRHLTRINKLCHRGFDRKISRWDGCSE